MQQKDSKTTRLAITIGNVIKQLRQNNNCSINKFAHENELDVGNISRIENGLTDIKVVTLWKISEALGIKPHQLFSLIEEELGNDFHFQDI